MKITNKNRQRLYDLGLALIAIATLYGIVDDQAAAAWALVLAPLLGLARSNVDV